MPVKVQVVIGRLERTARHPTAITEELPMQVPGAPEQSPFLAELVFDRRCHLLQGFRSVCLGHRRMGGEFGRMLQWTQKG